MANEIHTGVAAGSSVAVGAGGAVGTGVSEGGTASVTVGCGASVALGCGTSVALGSGTFAAGVSLAAGPTGGTIVAVGVPPHAVSSKDTTNSKLAVLI
ncbi:MAG: hypothetical protein ACP5JJ_16570 [Anaerolineae bacterium]